MHKKYGEYQDFKYYLANKEAFRRAYPNKYVIIRRQQIVGVYDNYAEAAQKASELYDVNDYHVQLCYSPEERYKKR